jgi:hypothetical protein
MIFSALEMETKSGAHNLEFSYSGCSAVDNTAEVWLAIVTAGPTQAFDAPRPACKSTWNF